MGFGNFDFMFNFMSLLFPVVFILILLTFIIIVVRGLKEWNNNNHSPVLNVNAQIVAKRGDVSHHHDSDGFSHTDTTYYVTFQVDSGDRMEFHVSGHEYGMLAEGDCGVLTFQGTRYLSFQRTERY